jgi:hypothetical protein
MADAEKPYGEMTEDELIIKMRGYTVSHSFYVELRAELDRRNIMAQITASKAQIRSAWFQLAAVIAMFLTVVATLATPWLARISH